MALFNYASTYDKVKSYVGKTNTNLEEFTKFIITGDGHIISHGVDYIPWTGGYEKVDNEDGTYTVVDTRKWSINYLPIALAGDDTSNFTLWSSATTEAAIKNLHDTVTKEFNSLQTDAMLFKGTIGITDDGMYAINGSIAGFPNDTAKAGDTYRIVKAGKYADNICEVGDLLICTGIADTLAKADATWMVAQANINGSVRHSINGVEYSVYSSDTSSAFNIYAPTTMGDVGELLTVVNNASTNKAEFKWVAPSLSYDNTTDKITLNINGAAQEITINGRRAVNVNGNTFLAKTNDTALDLCTTNGINVNTANNKVTFSVGSSYATDTDKKLFGVKVDSATNNLYVDLSTLTTPVVSSTLDGLAPAVTKETNKITNAYYVLASSNGETTPSWYQLPAEAFVNTWRDIKIDKVSIGTNTFNLISGDNITLSNNNGTVNISAAWRDIKVGDTSIGNNTLRFMPTGSVYVKTNDQVADTADTFDVGFELAWYNMDTEEYEF